MRRNGKDNPLESAYLRSTLAGPSPLTAEEDRQRGTVSRRCEYCGGVLDPKWHNCLECGRQEPDAP